MWDFLSGLGQLPAQPRPEHRGLDLFVVPTIGFNLLYDLVIVRLTRRELVWINLTPHPTAEAFPWNKSRIHRSLSKDAVPACESAPRRRHIATCPRRSSPPILQSLIFRYTQAQAFLTHPVLVGE